MKKYYAAIAALEAKLGVAVEALQKIEEMTSNGEGYL